MFVKQEGQDLLCLVCYAKCEVEGQFCNCGYLHCFVATSPRDKRVYWGSIKHHIQSLRWKIMRNTSFIWMRRQRKLHLFSENYNQNILLPLLTKLQFRAQLTKTRRGSVFKLHFGFPDNSAISHWVKQQIVGRIQDRFHSDPSDSNPAPAKHIMVHTSRN